jgi:adenine-specific DNA methylase
LILQKKKDTIFEGLKFIASECHAKTGKSFAELISKAGVLIRDCPAQSIAYSTLPRQSVDLVLTAPPYTDQVPYLEYCHYGAMCWVGERI